MLASYHHVKAMGLLEEKTAAWYWSICIIHIVPHDNILIFVGVQDHPTRVTLVLHYFPRSPLSPESQNESRVDMSFQFSILLILQELPWSCTTSLSPKRVRMNPKWTSLLSSLLLSTNGNLNFVFRCKSQVATCIRTAYMA